MAFLLHHNANEIVGHQSILGSIYPCLRRMANQRCRVYRAQETSATEPFAIALLCGDVRCDVSHISPSQDSSLHYLSC